MGFHRFILLTALLACAACSTQATPTLFVPPTAEPALPVAPTSAASPVPTATPTATATPLAATPTPCNNDLQFVQDLTIPDGTTVTPGAPVDKQWLVTNTGTCNWDSGYRLKMVSGDALGAPTEQALYPARAGTQPTLRIVFTAPQTAGTYQNAWQAFAPDGTAFGQQVFMQVNVSP
ncbi:MAG TPA: NBR1-Ig-like domain-containing protein [Anaerolineales bacterium]|nr:NBR1-Ig-like domain-containing protein [Anaerolineales bacterium]